MDPRLITCPAFRDLKSGEALVLVSCRNQNSEATFHEELGHRDQPKYVGGKHRLDIIFGNCADVVDPDDLTRIKWSSAMKLEWADKSSIVDLEVLSTRRLNTGGEPLTKYVDFV